MPSSINPLHQIDAELARTLLEALEDNDVGKGVIKWLRWRASQPGFPTQEAKP